MKDEQTEALKQFNDEQAKIVAEYVHKSNIAKLEKIRQEIYDIEEPDHDFEGFYYCYEKVFKIIDKELATLKGVAE